MLELSKLSQARAVLLASERRHGPKVWSVWQDGFLARENRLEEFPGQITAEER